MTVNLKERLQARKALLGTFVKTPHPAIVEILGTSGVDLVCLDAEHAPFDRGDLDACLMAGLAGGLPCLVRTPTGEAHHILNALDLGAAGVLVPHVRSGEEAATIARAAHYGKGGRGYAGATRATRYQVPSIGARLNEASAQTTVIVQIEDVEALECVAAIAQTPGVDAVFIGRIDLTVALGETDPLCPRMLQVVSDIIREAAPHVAVGLFTPDLGEVPRWRAEGASLFLLGSDQAFVRSGARALRQQSAI